MGRFLWHVVPMALNLRWPIEGSWVVPGLAGPLPPLAMKLVELSGTTRIFDTILPDIAEDSKTNFIRANPQIVEAYFGTPVEVA